MKIRTVTAAVEYHQIDDAIIKCNCVANNISVYLLSSKLDPDMLTIKKVDNGTYFVTVYPASGETIDGASYAVLGKEDDYKTFSPVAGGWTIIDSNSSQLRGYSLGTPVVADVDKIVTSANMKNGAYTIAAQPDVTRNITVTATAGDTADTMGKVTVVGTDYYGATISEEIVPEAGNTVAGVLAFKSITSVTGSGWAIDEAEGTNDTITVGVGNELGLPEAITTANNVLYAMLGGTVTADNATTAATVSGSTIDLSGGTYNGTKEVIVLMVG